MTPRRAIRADETIIMYHPRRTVSLRLYLSTVIFGMTIITLLLAVIVGLVTFQPTAQPLPRSLGIQQRSILPTMTITPTETSVSSPLPTPTLTPVPTVTPVASLPLTTTLFGWYDSLPSDYTFFSNSAIVSQTYLLCWAGNYIDGAELTLPIQHADLSQVTGQAGACIAASALPVDKAYRLGFISQAVRQGFIGQRTDWPILQLSLYTSTLNLPFPVLHMAQN